MKAVRVMKKEFPEKEILADLKIMDAGDYEAEEALKAGADYVTVLGVTDILTVKGCIDAANRYGKQVVVDMICVEDMPKKIAQMEEIQAHIIAVHVGADQQAAGREPLEDLKLMKECVKAAGVSVAGGINGKTISDYTALRPDIVIVGSGITHALDPVAEARKIYEAAGADAASSRNSKERTGDNGALNAKRGYVAGQAGAALLQEVFPCDRYLWGSTNV